LDTLSYSEPNKNTFKANNALETNYIIFIWSSWFVRNLLRGDRVL